MNASLAPSTQKAYQRAWDKFTNFSRKVLLKQPALPVEVPDLVLFVSYLHDNKASPSSIASIMSALSHLHKLAGVRDDTRNFLVTKVIAGARKVSPSADTRLPITSSVLKELLDALPCILHAPREATTFKAMFSLAFYGFLRIGEISPKTKKHAHSVIQFRDVSWQGKKSQAIITIRNFKNNAKLGTQNFMIRKEVHSNRRMCPVRALHAFLKLRGKVAGPLFTLNEQPIARRAFDRVLKDALSFCRYSTSKYKGHSFRIGAASEAAARGVPDARIRSLGRWNSDAFRKYIRLAISPTDAQ